MRPKERRLHLTWERGQNGRGETVYAAAIRTKKGPLIVNVIGRKSFWSKKTVWKLHLRLPGSRSWKELKTDFATASAAKLEAHKILRESLS